MRTRHETRSTYHFGVHSLIDTSVTIILQDKVERQHSRHITPHGDDKGNRMQANLASASKSNEQFSHRLSLHATIPNFSLHAHPSLDSLKAATREGVYAAVDMN